MTDPDLPASFRAIVEETSPALFRLAARITGSLEEAEDVLQDSYIKAWDALGRGRFDGRSHLRTWLYRIVANAATDALRSRKRREREHLEEDRDAASPTVSTEARYALRELASWLEELPADQRAALVLKELEGLSGQEIAEVMGCTEGAVEQRLFRARAALRERSERG